MHRNARLTPEGRRILCERIASGRPAAHVAAEMGVSRTTAYRWWRRYETEGLSGLYDRSSRPHISPNRTNVKVESRILELRRERKLGPARIGLILGMPASTVWRVLHRRACQVFCVRCRVHVVGSRRPGKLIANALSACFHPWVPVPSSPPLLFPMLRMAM